MVARIGRTHFEKCESFVHPCISQLQLSHPMTVPVMPLNQKFESLWKVTWHDKLGLNEVGGIWRKKSIQNVRTCGWFLHSTAQSRNSRTRTIGSAGLISICLSRGLPRFPWTCRGYIGRADLTDLFWNPNPAAVGVSKTIIMFCIVPNRPVSQRCRSLPPWRGWSCAECEHFFKRRF